MRLMAELPNNDSERTAACADALNRHGFAFQNRVIAEVESLRAADETDWQFEVAEFPVEIGPHGMRIDFVLWKHHSPYWILAECKRVNPRIFRLVFCQIKLYSRWPSGVLHSGICTRRRWRFRIRWLSYNRHFTARFLPFRILGKNPQAKRKLWGRKQ
jgi:hypothetical protein